MTLKVTKIVENTASCPIPANGFVLSIAEKSTYSSALSSLKAVQVGDTLTFSALCDDMWKGIAYACGGGDLLVEDGEALSDFTLDTKDEQRARTAIAGNPTARSSSTPPTSPVILPVLISTIWLKKWPNSAAIRRST